MPTSKHVKNGEKKKQKTDTNTMGGNNISLEYNEGKTTGEFNNYNTY